MENQISLRASQGSSLSNEDLVSLQVDKYCLKSYYILKSFRGGLMKKFFTAITVLLFLFTIPLTADYHIKQKQHTGEFSVMGQTQPAKDETQHLWLAENKMAMHGEQQSVIVDLNKNVMFVINHDNETYVEMNLPLDITQYFPAQMQQMMKNITVEVYPTGKTKTIGEWKCQGYNLSMNMMMTQMEMKVWASKDVPFDWKHYSSKMQPKFIKATMNLSDEAVQEFQKIEGFQIRSDSTMKIMGSEMKSYNEVEEISEETAPDGTYSVPQGYTQKEKFSMKDLQRRK